MRPNPSEDLKSLRRQEETAYTCSGLSWCDEHGLLPPRKSPIWRHWIRQRHFMCDERREFGCGSGRLVALTRLGLVITLIMALGIGRGRAQQTARNRGQAKARADERRKAVWSRNTGSYSDSFAEDGPPGARRLIANALRAASC